jgi:hypothetical protein
MEDPHMPSVEKEPIPLDCPGCRKPIGATYHDILTKPEIRCSKCHSGFRFDSAAKSHLRTALSNLDKAQRELSKAVDNLMAKVELMVKR